MKCIFCEKESNQVVCSNCLKLFTRNEKVRCDYCGEESSQYICDKCAVRIAESEVKRMFRVTEPKKIEGNLLEIIDALDLKKWVVFTGASGSGKTLALYLLAKRLARAKKQNAIGKIAYITYPEIVSSIKLQTSYYVIACDYIRHKRFLFLDDLFSYPATESEKNLLFAALDHRYRTRDFTAVGILDLEKKVEYEEQIISRLIELADGQIVDLGAYNRRFR